MSDTVRRPWSRVRLGPELGQVDVVGDVTINEALETATTYVAQFELFDAPEVGLGQAVEIEHVDFGAATRAAVFSGTVDVPEGTEGEGGHRHVLTASGPLARLRGTPAADVNLSGMTDGQAWQAILTACGVPFDPADIADAGYVLGAKVPVVWLADTEGSEIGRQLNEVFGMATIEVGAGRVVRFAYDRAPSAAAISATWTRGVDADVYDLGRRRGSLWDVLNVWRVVGATWGGVGADAGCQLTVWAHAEAPHPILGDPRRSRPESFQSDVIQDETLARAVATRLMRWHNRPPDEVRIEALNDPNASPGDVVGVSDPLPGLDLAAAASATPYLVLTVDRAGDLMTLSGVGGAAGATGTITSGVRRVCNRTKSLSSWPGPAFAPPAIATPPAVPVNPYDPLTDGYPEVSPIPTTPPLAGFPAYPAYAAPAVDPTAGPVPITPTASGAPSPWETDLGSPTLGPTGVVTAPPSDGTGGPGGGGAGRDRCGAVHTEELPFDVGSSWRIAATARLLSTAGAFRLGAMIEGDADGFALRVGGATAPTPGESLSAGDDVATDATTFAANADIALVLTYAAGSRALAATATQGATVASLNLTAASPDGTGPYFGDPLFVAFSGCDARLDAVEAEQTGPAAGAGTEGEVGPDDPGVPGTTVNLVTTGDWVSEWGGSVTENADSIYFSSDSSGYNNAVGPDVADDWRLSMTFSGGTAETEVTFGVVHTAFGYSPGAYMQHVGDTIEFGSDLDYQFVAPSGFVLTSPMTWTIRKVGNDLTMSALQGGTSYEKALLWDDAPSVPPDLRVRLTALLGPVTVTSMTFDWL